MIEEQNTARVRDLAFKVGIDCEEEDKLTLTFARDSESFLCRIERQRPDGRYQSMQVSADFYTGDRQLEQIISNRAASEMSRAVIAAVDQAFRLPPQPGSQKGVFLLPNDGQATILRYHWDSAKAQYRLIDTEELDNGAAMIFSEMADKLVAATNSLEA
jgi:hypothetical protein